MNSESSPTVSTQRFSTNAAIAIVIANMIGTGVFTSLGYQLLDIRSTFVLLLLWLVGGITALSGALTYAELGSRLPRSGGEYNFLKEIYHPAAGFISGWISATVGFAAPTALAAMTFGAYLEASVPSLPAMPMAVGLVLLVTAFHAYSRSASQGLQTSFTLLKLILIVVFMVLVVWAAEPQPITLVPQSSDTALILSSAFAVSLIYVNYAYTGWNAATYILNELDEPATNISKILFVGTLTVLATYLLLNYVFLHAAPMDAMSGNIEIGVIVAKETFGDTGAVVMGVTLALLLISTVSAMIIAGPRVLQIIGEDFRVFRILGQRNSDGIPMVAILVQSALTVGFIVSATFESILVFSGFIMGLNTLFAVAGVFVLRIRDPQSEGYRTWGYPVTPMVFIALMAWTLVHILINRPEEAWFALGLVAVGALLYIFSEKTN